MTDSEMILLQGKLLFVKADDIDPLYAIDALDYPALMLQLVLKILAYTVPEGPQGIKETKNIDFLESLKSIKVATASASGKYGTPWKVKGSLVKDISGIIHFDLLFTYSFEGKSITDTFRGSWQIVQGKQNIDYTLNVKDYQVFSLGVRKMEAQGGMTIDYGTEAKEPYETLQDALNDI